MHAVGAFKADVKAVVAEQGLHVSNWKNGSYRTLSYQANREILEDAFKQQGLLKDIFSPLSLIFERSCKTVARLEAKRCEVEKRGGEHFKVVSDFVAARVPCKVREMADKIDCIRKIVRERNGLIYVRGETQEQPHGSFKKGTSFSDIVQFVYVYLEEIGYPIEFQVGHPFAFHTFTIDSKLRDDPQCGLVDLWKEDFYTKVRSAILNPTNKNLFDEIEQIAKGLHQGEIPQELNKLLINIFLESCETLRDFKDFVRSHPDLDIAFHKNELIDCYARLANPCEYYVYNAKVIRKDVQREIESESFVHKIEPADVREKMHGSITFCKKLLGYIPEDPVVDYSPSKEVFMRANERNMPIKMSCGQAIRFACEVGVDLTKLNLSLFTDSVLEESLEKLVASCPNIRSFVLGSCIVNSQTYGFDPVVEILKIPSIEEFTLSDRIITDAGYEAMKRLKAVDVYNASFQDSAAAILAKSTTLETLKIQGRVGYGGFRGGISDQALEDFKNCKTLKHLDIHCQTGVSQEAIKALREARPDLTVKH